MKVDIPHSKSTIWKCTAQMADKVQYSQHERTRLLSGGRVCLVSYFMSTCSIIASLLTSECRKALTIWQEIPLVEIVTSQAAPTSHFYHPKALWLCIQSLRGGGGKCRQMDFLRKITFSWKTKNPESGWRRAHVCLGDWRKVKVDYKLLYMYYSGDVQWPNRLLSSPGAQYAEVILEADVQRMKWLKL